MGEGEIKLKSGEGTLQLKELSVNAEIVSGVAIATVDMVFFNNLHKQLEGELDFPLPEDAVVCGYSYEFEGHMVPASVVEKEEARITFEKEVRAGGAVSLVEIVKGNSFKVRVYPLPPNASKRVSITFMLDLPSSDSSMFFSLPFSVSGLSKLSLSVSVQQPHTQPQALSDFEELQIEENNGSYRYTVSKGEGAAMGPSSFKVTIPTVSVSEPNVFIGEKDLARKGEEDETFVMVHDFPQIPQASAGGAKNLKIGIMWDGSYSVNGINRTREYEILRQLSSSASTFDLTVFRNTQEPVVSFAGKDVEKLIKHLEEIIYDGGSDLANLKFSTGCDKILWFTDGFSTLSADIPTDLPSSPVFVFVSSTKANIKSLKFVANKTGGQFFNLIESESDSKIVSSVTKAAAFRFLYASYDKNAVSDLFPDASFVVEEGQKVSFVGKLKQDLTKLELHYGTDPSAPSLTRSLSLSKSNSIGHSDIIPRVWAQLKSESLALLQEENKKEIVELGRRYGLVTPGTSLLVLTTFDQYLKYGIEPDADALPEVHDAYMSHHKNEKKDKDTKREAKLSKVYSWWETRKQWWERDFSTAQKNAYHNQLQAKAPPKARVSRKSSSESLKKNSIEEKVSSDSLEMECSSESASKPKKKSFFGLLSKKESSAPVKEKSMKKKSSAPMEEKESNSAYEKSSAVMDSCFAQEEEMCDSSAFDDFSYESKSECIPQSLFSAPPPPPMASQSFSLSAPCAPPAPCPPPPAPCAAPMSSSSSSSSLFGGPPPPPGGVPPPPPLGGAPPPSSQAAPSVASAGIAIKEWSPDRPYLRAIKAQSNVNEQYKIYAQQRTEFGSAPSFFLDCANLFYSSSSPHLGIRIITSILELKLEDPRLLRIVAYSLSSQKQHTQSQWLFIQVVRLRSEEPQSFRDLAVSYVGDKQYQKAIDNFWKVIETEWPVRFQHIEDEVLTQLNRTIFEAQQDNNNNNNNNEQKKELDVSKIDKRFIKLMPVNIHCTIAWDTDDTCIDLHIIEPTGTKCYYGHHITDIGGWSTPDYSGCTAFSTSMLREYMIKNAMPGEYKLGCNYYSNSRQDLTAGTTMWFTVTTNFGTPEQVSNTTTLRLECNSTAPSTSSFYDIGTVAYGINSVYQEWLNEWERKQG